ncbi:hypothetical protein [Leptolyngbya sp. BC1307]|uniref:hypothetical protein n=1 Tax=Leptolyngbya sp. BC1307 TaxID=2029589 RepID=UPI001140DB67|nr:hypothetical protein [Leptolyngbya sp. BC1307]
MQPLKKSLKYLRRSTATSPNKKTTVFISSAWSDLAVAVGKHSASARTGFALGSTLSASPENRSVASGINSELVGKHSASGSINSELAGNRSALDGINSALYYCLYRLPALDSSQKSAYLQ